MSNKRVRGNGKGSIYQQNNRWVMAVHVNDSNGKKKRIKEYFDFKGEAENRLEEIRCEIRSGKFVCPNKITLSEWVQRFIPTIRKGCTDNVYHRKLGLIRDHIDGEKIGQKPIQDILPIELENYYLKLQETGKKKKVTDEHGNVMIVSIGGLSAQTARHIHNIICPALEKAVDNGLIVRNPALKVDKKNVLKLVLTREARPLEVDEVAKYLKFVAHRRLASLFTLDLCTGMRRGELLGLQWPDLNHETHELRIERAVQRVQNIGSPGSSLQYTKLKSESSYRTIKLPLLAYNELLVHKERQDKEKAAAGAGYKDEGLIFCTAIGTKLDPRRIYTIHCEILERAKIKHTAFHNLRHTVATLLLENGENAKSIQELLGHCDVRTTLSTYAHVFDKMKAATAEKLDGIIGDALSKYIPETSLEVTENNV